jgi:hypothetical protein
MRLALPLFVMLTACSDSGSHLTFHVTESRVWMFDRSTGDVWWAPDSGSINNTLGWRHHVKGSERYEPQPR